MVDATPYLEPRIAPRSIFDRLAERASRVRFMVPDGDDWRAVTWQAHATQIRQVALFLGAELESGERAAIFAHNRVEWLAAALGVQAAGGVMVPIYASSTADQAAYIIEHADARVLFVDQEQLLERVISEWERLEGVRRVVLLGEAIDLAALLARMEREGKRVPARADVVARLVTWDRAMAMGAARDREEPGAFERVMSTVSLEQPGLMLYTSGTSGRPKGVPLTHLNVGVNGADWMRCLSPLVEEGDVDLLWLPMSHIFGFGEACLGNTLGWTSYLSDPRTVVSDLPRVRPHVFMSVPSVWEKLAIESAGDDHELRTLTGGNLRLCLSGGAGLKRDVKERFHEAGLLVIEGYGLTEASPTLTLNRPDAFRFDSVGKPVPSIEVRLAEDGEILARGESIFGGYHKDPEATAEVITADGWLKTGDIGRWIGDGFLQIVDRKKDIFVTAGGKNIAPANIEVRFRDDPIIAHLVVYGDGQKYLTAAVWLHDTVLTDTVLTDTVLTDTVLTDTALTDTALTDTALTDAALTEEARRALVQPRIDAVNAELAGYETIKKFVIVGEPLTVEGGLLTPTFKPKRKAIIERYRDQLRRLYA